MSTYKLVCPHCHSRMRICIRDRAGTFLRCAESYCTNKACDLSDRPLRRLFVPLQEYWAARAQEHIARAIRNGWVQIPGCKAKPVPEGRQ